MATVLIVDDERSIRLSFQALLRAAGHTVAVAEDSGEALSLIDDQEFDVAVLDVVLPRSSGVELARWIHERAPRTHVVLITGRPTLDSAAAAVRAGAFDYLTKPVPSQTLLTTVHRAAEAKAREDEIARLQDENRRYQRDLEQLVEKRTARLRRSEGRLRALAAELTRVEERERRSLATYLHDEIGQALAVVRMKLALLVEDVAEGRSIGDEVEGLRDLLGKAIESTQTLTFDLSPPVLHELGLAAAIEWAGERTSEEHGLTFVFHDDGTDKPLDDEAQAFLFRSARELMANVVKHAQATRLCAAFVRHDGEVRVVIEDNGTGFRARSQDSGVRLGFGLFSIRQRLGGLDGRFEIEPMPGGGTKAVLSVPVKAS